MEYKVFDATANVYLGVAALMCAGMEGLRAGKSLPMALGEDPGSLTDADRKSRGVARLPATMDDALKATHADKGALRYDNQHQQSLYIHRPASGVGKGLGCAVAQGLPGSEAIRVKALPVDDGSDRARAAF